MPIWVYGITDRAMEQDMPQYITRQWMSGERVPDLRYSLDRWGDSSVGSSRLLEWRRPRFFANQVRTSGQTGRQLDYHCRGYIPVVRQIQDINLPLQETCASNVWEDRRNFPEVTEKLYEIPTVGAAPEFYGRIPETAGSRGLPREVQKTPEIARKLRKLIRQRKAFVCSKSKLSDMDGFSPTPSGLVEKRNPDRTASVGARLISDSRAVKLGFRKRIFPPYAYRRFLISSGKYRECDACLQR